MINLIELLNQVVFACPDVQNDSNGVDVLENLIIDIGSNSLLQLTKSSSDYKELISAILLAKVLLKDLYTKLLTLKLSVNGFWNGFIVQILILLKNFNILEETY